MSGHVYSVPAAVVFRRWAAHADPAAPIKRKLLLKNDGERAVSFRLSLPQHAAFEVSGSLVASASPGEVCDVIVNFGMRATVCQGQSSNEGRQRANSPTWLPCCHSKCPDGTPSHRCTFQTH